jgi:hypothetical protein
MYYGIKVGCPMGRLITHDLSKLSWTEYPAYQQQFFGDKGNQVRFQRAWNHHWHTNDHHWENHISFTRHDKGTPRGSDYDPLPMPEDAVLEMLSDWCAASRTYSCKPIDINDWEWLNSTWPVISKRMHGDTKTLVMQILFKLGRKHLCP